MRFDAFKEIFDWPGKLPGFSLFKCQLKYGMQRGLAWPAHAG
jgi:hypothetical protein